MGGGMTAADLILQLRSLGVKLVVNEQRLQFCPKSAVTPDLLAQLQEKRSELLAILASNPAAGIPLALSDKGLQPVDSDDVETAAERAAIQWCESAPPEEVAAALSKGMREMGELTGIPPTCCLTCSPAKPTGERQQPAAVEQQRTQMRANGATWPISGADAVLQLTPEDLPPPPWRVGELSCYDNSKLLNELRIDLTVIGRNSPHRRSGRLRRDVERLLRLAQSYRSGQVNSEEFRERVPNADLAGDVFAGATGPDRPTPPRRGAGSASLDGASPTCGTPLPTRPLAGPSDAAKMASSQTASDNRSDGATNEVRADVTTARLARSPKACRAAKRFG